VSVFDSQVFDGEIADVNPVNYKTMIFQGITFTSLQDGVKPHFKCPVCGYTWTPTLNLGTEFPEPFDFNQTVSFAIPNHQGCTESNYRVELYIAVHSEDSIVQSQIKRSDTEGGGGESLMMEGFEGATSGIPVDWWVKRT